VQPLAADCAGDGNLGNGLFAEGGVGAVPQRDADLLHLYVAYQRAAAPAAKASALAALDAEVDRRRAVDGSVRAAVWALLQQPAVLAQLRVSLSPCGHLDSLICQPFSCMFCCVEFGLFCGFPHCDQGGMNAWMQAKYASTNLLLPTEQLLSNSVEAQALQEPIVEQFVSAPLPRTPGLALVDDWDCLRVMPALDFSIS
jgi:hypothetical protein